ncbi:hypothetical protein [Caldilinea sp.]|uniref:hypothetical protein n=1 Tax=Caldilinea sp. TaxID=2293560 RepID=UPI0021DCF949|nr:hypothetical protein [Caldilinea sp.]GIV75127.1 MAG: hypothetical protein KatS3mg049_3683 [Caldilinea sp.]
MGTGDDRKLAASLKRQNKAERQGQLTLFGWNFDLDLTPLVESAQQIESIPDDSPQNVRRKRETYEARLTDPRLRRLKDACDLYTAAFFQPLSPSPVLPLSRSPITTDAIRRALAGQPVMPQTLAEAQALAEENRFFHWPLEFPEVFASRSPALQSSPALPLSSSPAHPTGFDVILGNPPWERIKLQEEEFFASRDAAIARAPNAAARKRLIAGLPQTAPALWQDYQRALHNAESVSRFLRASGQYPLTGRGDINTYSVFAERVRNLLGLQGRAGIIVPTGIATDATNQFFFADLVEKGQLLSLFDFENREALFPGVHRSYKFCLLTLCGERENTRAREHESPALPLSSSHALTLSPSPNTLTFSFFATRPEHLRDPRRVFRLTAADIARINPNTRTLPVFRTRQDADLTRAIYQRVPVLVNEHTDENPWGVRFLAMFHMSNDSHLFRTRAELEAQGCRLAGNVFMKSAREEHETSHALTLSRSPDALTLSPSPALYLPLYEAKMLWHYDHRYGTYEGVSDRSSTQLPTPDERQHADPHFVVQPWYWVPAEEVEARLGEWQRGWLLGFRDVTNATNERTAIFSLLPRVGAGNNLPILLFSEKSNVRACCLLANLNAQAFDYVTRQKIAGVHMNFFFVSQLPVLPPDAYTPEDLRFIVPRVLELVYTAWDLQPFAQDVWNEADAPLRAAILGQERESTGAGEHESTRMGEHENAHALTLSRSQNLPLSRSHPLPLSPFTWNESRRAVLRAELDAYYARLYGLTRKQLRYILDPADLTERELADLLDPWEEVSDPLDPAGYAARVAASAFPGETFRVMKEKEQRQYGEYRTRRLVLEAWERLKSSKTKSEAQ